ncbi:MAG: DUF4006 family protein [Helicobacteraceae bacterium]|jgi:hypothetical protein|nr:DUF4006 family protein [Helicobacteraceae bacterium]
MSSQGSGSYFALNGISGMLVAVVLLLGIIGTLTTLGIITQQASANNPYVVRGEVVNPKSKEEVFKNLKAVKMNDADGEGKRNAFFNANTNQ